MSNPILISVVSPVYRAEKIVDELVRRIVSEVEKITPDFEIILVEDAGKDNSWQKIEENCRKDPRVKGIKLSRNFGQHYAITAGVQYASGECVVLMDCDLQDDPANIGILYSEFRKGNDIVYTRRKKRKHSLRKAFSSWLFNLMFKFFSNKDFDVNYGSLVLFSKRVAAEFNKFKEHDRLYIQLLKWLGYKHTTVEMVHQKRFEGETSYTFGKLLSLALQGWTAHSDKLLKMSIYIGFFLSFFSFLAILLIVFLYFQTGFQSGWASLSTIILFSTGMILVSTGILGIYIGKIFEQSKSRPLFVIEEKLNL